jgi:hypothetical protein
MKLTTRLVALMLVVAANVLASASAHAQDFCTQEQTDAIEAARARALELATNAMDDLVDINNGGDTSRFDRWFSSTDNGALEVVQTTMSFIWARAC